MAVGLLAFFHSGFLSSGCVTCTFSCKFFFCKGKVGFGFGVSGIRVGCGCWDGVVRVWEGERRVGVARVLRCDCDVGFGCIDVM